MSYSSEVLADSPLAYYRLGEASGTTLTDSSGNSRNGTYVGSPGLGAAGLLASSADKAVNFDGVDDRATVASATWMDVANFTLEAWVNLDTIPASGVAPIIYRLNFFPGSTPGFALNVTSAGKVRADMVRSVTGTAFAATSATTLVPGTTYHVVGTWNSASNTLSVYVNGTLDGSTATSGEIGALTEPLHIGARPSNSAGTTFHYADGRIDEAALYGAALSAARIAAHYTAGAGAVIPTGTLSATLPALSASLSGTYDAPPVTGTIGATLPAATASLAGGYAPPAGAPIDGALDATLPPLTSSLAGAYAGTITEQATTDSVDRANGRTRVCEWSVEVEPPVTSPTRDRGLDESQAYSISGTTLVDGRPT